jgi:hypothetical protein
MDQQALIMVGTVALMLCLGGLAALVAILRITSASRGSKQAWNTLGYQPGEGGRGMGLGRASAHYVRNYSGFEIHYLTSHKQASVRRTQMMHTWLCELPQPARFGLQVVEAGIADASLGARAARAVGSYKYGWERQFDQSVETGDAKLDRRFAIFSSHPDAASHLLAEPGMRDALLSLKHVDLTVAGSKARFDDPFMVNLWRKTGQGLAEIHNQIAEIVTRAGRGASTA